MREAIAAIGMAVALLGAQCAQAKTRLTFMGFYPEAKAAVFLSDVVGGEGSTTHAWFLYVRGGLNTTLNPQADLMMLEAGYDCSKGLSRTVFSNYSIVNGGFIENGAERFGRQPHFSGSVEAEEWSIICGKGLVDDSHSLKWSEAIKVGRAMVRGH